MHAHEGASERKRERKERDAKASVGPIDGKSRRPMDENGRRGDRVMPMCKGDGGKLASGIKERIPAADELSRAAGSFA